jgi:hypothetical protein
LSMQWQQSITNFQIKKVKKLTNNMFVCVCECETIIFITTTDCIQVNCVCDERHYNLMCDTARCKWFFNSQKTIK